MRMYMRGWRGAVEKGMMGWRVSQKVGTGKVATRTTYLAYSPMPQGCSQGIRLAPGPGPGWSSGLAGSGLRSKSPTSCGSQRQ
jgi:hypothetical protein